jgi:hypothetical protein
VNQVLLMQYMAQCWAFMIMTVDKAVELLSSAQGRTLHHRVSE